MGDINRKFGENLRRLREKYKLTQEQLAQLAEVDYKYIQRLEGKTPSSPSLNIIERIAKAFKVSPAKLLDF
jgi:transcriptional regulator with XRE-family HTH domain